jgi:hypothetical protein
MSLFESILSYHLKEQSLKKDTYLKSTENLTVEELSDNEKFDLISKTLTGIYAKHFKKSVFFERYENNTLYIRTNYDNKSKRILRMGYSRIKHIVRELYGLDTKIINCKNLF